tara:strand:+ start:835 stop:1038 length:204 start_codon:yes stop_codon:yes gene_type:complete
MKKNKKINFEDSMSRLEDIVNLLEDQSTTLEQSIELFEEGMSLTNSCKEILKKTESRIKNLLKEEKN